MTARCGSTARDLCSMPVSWLSSKWNVHLLKCVSQQWTRQCSCHLATNRPSCSERLWRQWLVFFSWEPVFCIFVLLFHWKVSLSRFRKFSTISPSFAPCVWRNFTKLFVTLNMTPPPVLLSNDVTNAPDLQFVPPSLCSQALVPQCCAVCFERLW